MRKKTLLEAKHFELTLVSFKELRYKDVGVIFSFQLTQAKKTLSKMCSSGSHLIFQVVFKEGFQFWRPPLNNGRRLRQHDPSEEQCEEHKHETLHHEQPTTFASSCGEMERVGDRLWRGACASRTFMEWEGSAREAVRYHHQWGRRSPPSHVRVIVRTQLSHES